MAEVRLACAKCGAVLKSARAIPPGKEITCPRCKQSFVVPGLEETTAAPVPPTADVPPAGAVQAGAPAGGAAFPQIAGYTILDRLGQGGMGVVYKARQEGLGRLVALKMILAGAHAPAADVARFRSEAKIIAQLQHPNIVQIYDVGEHGGLPYITLEFVNGPTLAKRLAGTPQPNRAAAELVELLARAVAVAHQRGIIHRDLKPSNVLLSPPGKDAGSSRDTSETVELYGVPKVMDFGLAKRLDSEAGQTRTGTFLGTAAYAAPEQARGRTDEIGPATDVYGLGAILYEMLTGRPPFQGSSTFDILHQVATEEPQPPRRHQPYVARDLETICLKCLSKDPRRRYPSALALAEELRRYLNGEPLVARRSGPLERLGRWCRRYPVAASLLAAFTLCLVFGFWYHVRLTDHLVRSAALESAAQQSDILLEVNNSYSDVVRRAKNGHLDVRHDYSSHSAAIPIPATFTIELGQQISDRSDSGVQVRLYSPYWFPSRRNGGPKDDFEREAWRRLSEDPDQPVYSFEDYKGRPSLRYATARRMQKTCVECHNTHPDSPKTDWQEGDVRGVVEIIYPLEKDVTRTQEGIRGALLFVGGVFAALLCLAGLAVLVRYLRRRRQGGAVAPSI